MTTYGLYDEDDARRIKSFVDSFGDGNPAATTNYKAYKRQEIYLVRLTEDLAAASNSLTGYTQATARVIRLKNDDSLDREEATDTSLDIEVTNRSSSAWSEDDELWVIRVEAEYVPFSASAGTGGAGTCCCCDSTPSADVLLSDGISTVRTWQPCTTLEPIKVIQTHGTLTITFPSATSMDLVKDSVNDYFEYVIPGTAFTATYWDGTSATSDLTSPTGTVRFYHTTAAEGCETCPQMRVVITWTADIPEQLADEPL